MTTFIDGFEQVREDPMRLMPLAGYSLSSVSGAAGRLPGAAAVLVQDGALTKVFDISGTEATAGAAVKASGRTGTLFQLAGFSVGLDPITGFPVMAGVTGQTIPALDKFYYFEIHLDWAEGTARFFINGRLDIEAPLVGAVPTSVTVRMQAGAAPEQPVSPCTFDDFYFHEGPPLGPVEVLTQMANQNATPQDWQASAGTDDDPASHAEMVGEINPDPLDKYILSDQPGAEDTFTSDAVASRDDEVRAVSVLALARVTARSGQPLLARSGALGADAIPLGLLYEYHAFPVEYAPGTLASVVTPQEIAVEVGAP